MILVSTGIDVDITIVSHFLFMSHLTFTINHSLHLMEASSLIINLLFDLEHKFNILTRQGSRVSYNSMYHLKKWKDISQPRE